MWTPFAQSEIDDAGDIERDQILHRKQYPAQEGRATLVLRIDEARAAGGRFATRFVHFDCTGRLTQLSLLGSSGLRRPTISGSSAPVSARSSQNLRGLAAFESSSFTHQRPLDRTTCG